MKRFFCLSAVAACAFTASSLGAQVVNRFALEASVGIARSTGGEYMERETYAADLMLLARLNGQTVASGLPSTVGSIAAGGAWNNGSDLVCIRGSAGQCMPGMPSYQYLALMIGRQATVRANAFAVTAGPALVRFESTTRAGSHINAIGAHARLNYATPSVAHLSFALSPRVTVARDEMKDWLALFSFGIGIRVVQ